MQVLRNQLSPIIVKRLWRVLNQPSLPFFDIEVDELQEDHIRGLSEFDKLVRDVISSRDVLEEEIESEVDQPEKKVSRETQVDERADPIMAKLSETCGEAQEAYERWRSPKFVGRTKIDDKIEEQRMEFETTRVKVFARDIGRYVDRLISLGYQSRHFKFSVYSTKEKKNVIRSHSEIIADIENATSSEAPELLSELITCVMVIFPSSNQQYQELHIISPSIADVGYVKEQA